MTWLWVTSMIWIAAKLRGLRSGLRVIGAASTFWKCARAGAPTTSVPPSPSMARTPPVWSMWWCAAPPAHRLAGKLLLHCLHHPRRLAVGDRRVEDHQEVAHLDDHAVVRAADDVVTPGAISCRRRPGDPLVS